jgi:diaminobutyrate-2-oxoglutarate transaminase
MSQGEQNFEELHFEPAPALDGEVPGPLSREMLAQQDELESNARSYPRSVPVAIEAGRGATMKDVDGNTFIDFFGGAGVLNVGHSHPDVLAAAAEQERKLVHALDFPTKPKLRLMGKLKTLLPGRLRESAKFHFGGPTGSDAIESALKLTRAHTGRDAVIAFQGSYHGMTTGALSVTSDVGFGGPTSSPVHFMPYPYCYRCPLGLKPDSCELACANLLDSSLEDPHSGIPHPAAVLIEPIQGEGGTIVPPDGYLSKVRAITRKHDVPLICDEIQTGFARTGTMFACEHDGVSPDVITLSKALGGIGYPISCIAYDPELDTWKQGAHIGTFRGHQVAMAAGLAAIEFMQEVNLPAHAASLGELTLELLREAQDTLASVGDVRGRGLMIGIELVKDRDTKQPWPEMAAQVRTECFRKGVIIEVGGHYGNVARFLPPLVITRELLLTGVEIFVESVRAAEEALAQPAALIAG